MKIRLILGGTPLMATLNESATAREFAALLPLRLTLEDYASTEKICDLPSKLSIEGAPAGNAARAGDIAYYAPWGNLAVFHRSFGSSEGLVTIGRIDGGIEVLQRPVAVSATFERI